jgi:hypothetical protein
MLEADTVLGFAFHRTISSNMDKDCRRRAIATGIQTWLVDSTRALPRQLVAGDARL